MFKVKFQESDVGKCYEVQVKDVYPSDIIGLITLDTFIFRDQTSQVLLPSEDEACKRFKKTKKIHIPYHNIVYAEELETEKIDLKNLPFLKEFSKNPDNMNL